MEIFLGFSFLERDFLWGVPTFEDVLLCSIRFDDILWAVFYGVNGVIYFIQIFI